MPSTQEANPAANQAGRLVNTTGEAVTAAAAARQRQSR